MQNEILNNCTFVSLQMTISWLLLLLISTFHTVKGLYGYDCGDHLSNLTTISLLDIGDCDIKKPTVNVTRTYAQLLQLNEYSSLQVYKCSVKITRIITHCGMHSHASRVSSGEISYYKELSPYECDVMQRSGYFQIGETRMTGIQGNSTHYKHIVLAGRSDNVAECKGGSYADPYGRWDNVYVAGWVEISLQDYYTPVHLNSNKIILKTGVRCTFSERQCIDYDGAHIFWETIPEDFCGLDKYSVLYEGYLNKIHDEEEQKVMYSLESDDITFALWKTTELHKCGYIFYATEHPKLFILEDTHSGELIKKATISATNLDIFAYVNSKFLYIEKHIRGQFRELYYKILQEKCELERKVLKNAISIATISPEEFGYRLMESNGYIGVVAGEAVHLLKCLRVEVKIRNTTKCYEQLPVRRGEEELFLAPRTRILIRTGTQITCDSRIPAMFRLDNNWYKMLPMPIIGEKPETLKPQSKPTWKYMSPETLAIGGIYGEKDLNRLRDMILFPVEKPTVLNQIALGMTGKSENQEGIAITNMFDERAIQVLAKNTWDRMWSSFLAFGTASAGLIGVIMLCRLIKLLIDTIIHGYAIYSLYGFSIHLLGAIWNSVTQLLLHLGQQQQDKGDNKVNKNKEKKTVQRKQIEAVYENPTCPQEPLYTEIPIYQNQRPDSA